MGATGAVAAKFISMGVSRKGAQAILVQMFTRGIAPVYFYTGEERFFPLSFFLQRKK